MSAIDFASPSFRAAGQDLAVSISPLGLVELADEEFEVHGPRLNRYSINWAMYLGHHYSYRVEAGEEQPTYNYYRAFTDFLTRFTFGHGVQFSSPEVTDAIVPHALKRVWEVDNDKQKVLFELGTSGAVSGDCFAKVAYEEPYEDSVGIVHPGRVRILPLNSAYCFPEFHPHDRSRIIRMKIKYRFWGTSPQGTRSVYTYCVDDATEALTQQGWKKRWELTTEDKVLAIDPDTDEILWEPVLEVCEFPFQGDLVRFKGEKLDSLTTWNHRWLMKDRAGKSTFTTTAQLIGRTGTIYSSGGTPAAFAQSPTYSDDFVKLVGWSVTEGHYTSAGALTLSQSKSVNPEHCEELTRLTTSFSLLGNTSVYGPRENGVMQFYFSRPITEMVKAVAPPGGERGGAGRFGPEFLCSLTLEQAETLYEVMYQAEGSKGVTNPTLVWAQKDEYRTDMFQMLCSMLGKSSTKKYREDNGIFQTTIYKPNKGVTVQSLKQYAEHYDGTVWCPRVRTKTFLARRNGKTYWTGNTEILDDNTITEYVNDEMIDQRDNPIGRIPIVHIPNLPIPSSPWGLSDCQDIIQLNLQYNAINKDISDIVNYHAAPITIITGAKASNLEKGAKKVWGGLPKEAQVFNLEGGGQGLQGAIEYMERIKRSMHEIIGIPETALGQVQPISNTSGVALSIQFQPLMNRYSQKVAQYAEGLEKINELILLTLAVKEPEAMQWVPNDAVPLKDGQVDVLDPSDPETYMTTAHFPPPLPLDRLVLLNEIQMELQMNLQSREGALRKMGEEYPEHKLAEIQEELLQDAVDKGVRTLLETEIQKEIMDLTAMMPGIDGGPATPLDPMMAEMPDGSILGDAAPNVPQGQMSEGKMGLLQGEEGLRQRLLEKAFGTKMPSSGKASAPNENAGE